MTARSVPPEPSSAALVTVSVLGVRRSSRVSNRGRQDRARQGRCRGHADRRRGDSITRAQPGHPRRPCHDELSLRGFIDLLDCVLVVNHSHGSSLQRSSSSDRSFTAATEILEPAARRRRSGCGHGYAGEGRRRRRRPASKRRDFLVRLPMTNTSATLLQRLLNHGDAAAWTRFTQLYAPLIRASLGRHLPQAADVDDLAQQVFTVVVEKLPEFRHSGRPGAFRAWLRGICVNRVRMFWRTRPADRPRSGSGPAAARRSGQRPEPAVGPRARRVCVSTGAGADRGGVQAGDLAGVPPPGPGQRGARSGRRRAGSDRQRRLHRQVARSAPAA